MSYDNSGAGALLAGLLLLTLFGLILGIALYIITSFFLMKIFDKAGVQGRWRAWVPIYNYMVFSKLGDLSPWLVLIGIGAAFVLSFLGLGWLGTLAMFVALALAAWRIGLKLQKEVVWVVLFVLLSPIWLGILAFDKSRWNAAVPAAPWAGNGFLADRTVWAGVPAGQAVAPSAPAAPEGYAPPPPAGYAPPPAASPAPPAAPPAAPAAPAAPPAAEPPAAPPAAEPPAAPPAAEPPAAPAPPAAEPPAPPAPPAAEPPAPPAVDFGDAPPSGDKA